MACELNMNNEHLLESYYFELLLLLNLVPTTGLDLTVENYGQDESDHIGQPSYLERHLLDRLRRRDEV